MGVFFVYSLKVALCLIAFYLVQKLLLSREKMHALNRNVIFMILLLSLTLPYHSPLPLFEEKVTINSGWVELESAVLSADVVYDSGQSGLSLIQVFLVIYIIGIAFFLLREIMSVVRLYAIIRRGTLAERRDGAKIIVVDEDIAPFSWFRYVILSKKDYNSSCEILIHELAHVRKYHSWEILFCNLMIIYQWYNPAAWLLRRELQDVHEFEADDAVLEEGVDAKQYQMLLIKKSVGERLFSMANNLNHNSLKRRIRMMKTKESSFWHRLKGLALLAVVFGMPMVFASPSVEALAGQVKTESEVMADELLPSENVSVQDTLEAELQRGVGITPQTQAKLAAAPKKQAKSQGKLIGKVFSVVEHMPEFPGGAPELYQYLARNIKYPKSAMERKVQGRVISQFVVRKDGSITDVKIVKGVDAELDAEAVRVISGMPKWKPGMLNGKAVDVKYTVPVTFRLDTSKNTASDGGVTVVSYPKEKKVVSMNDGEKVQIRNNNDKGLVVEGPATTGKIAFIINGKKSTEEDFKALDPKSIESITVIKKKEALAEMGYSDYDGALVLETK